MEIKKLVYTYSPAVIHPYIRRIEASDVGSRLARGVFWSIVGSSISRGLMLLATILVARMLGKTGFGELGMVKSTIGMFGVFAGFGLGLTAIKHVAEFRLSDPDRAGRIMALSGLFAILTGGAMALGLIIFAPWLAENTINAPHLAGVLRISALILFLNAINGAQTGALAGFEAFKTIARVNLVIGLLSFPILIGGAYYGGVTGAVWALAINLCFNWLINHLALRKEAQRFRVPFSLSNCGREWPILWKFTLPAVLAGSLVAPVNWVCSAMLVNEPGGYEEMGIFSAANQWYTLLMFLPSMLGGVILPVLSEQIGQNKTKQSVKTLVLAIKLNLVFVIPLVFVASICSPYIMSLYGEGFDDGWPTLVIVLITTGLIAAQTPVGQIIVASGRLWVGFAMNLGWGLTFIVITLVLIDHGSLGVATARMLSYILHAIWTLGFAILLIRKEVNN